VTITQEYVYRSAPEFLYTRNESLEYFKHTMIMSLASTIVTDKIDFTSNYFLMIAADACKNSSKQLK